MTQEQEARDFGKSDDPKISRLDHSVIRDHFLAEEVKTEDAGVFAHKLAAECFLDALYHKGRLRYASEPAPPKDEEARRRLQAGLWLRSLFERSGLRQRETMAYSIFGQGGGGAEMSDAEAWNMRCWADTMRELGAVPGYVLRSVCCFDALPAKRSVDLRWCLDLLADLRGI